MQLVRTNPSIYSHSRAIYLSHKECLMWEHMHIRYLAEKTCSAAVGGCADFFSRTKSSIYGIYSSISWRGWWYLLIAIFISIVLARVEWWWRIWEPFKQTEACSSIEQQLYKWHITQRRENVIFLPKSNFYGPLCCRYISVVFVQKRLIS